MSDLPDAVVRLQAVADERRAIRLDALSRTDALARIASRPAVWRVEQILTSDDYGGLAGPKGVGKSLAFADLSVAVALGESWFGRFATTQSRVLLLTGEDSEARVLQRLDAIARSLGRDPEELEGQLFVHPLPFSLIRGIDSLAAELDAIEPGLTIVDPAYKYLAGARTSSLFDMGEVLTPLQVRCQDANSAFLLSSHYNRRAGAEREERITGAGVLEWARVVVTVEAPPRRSQDPDVVAMFQVTGNSLDPLTFSVRRRVVSLGEGPGAELEYSVQIVAEGADAVRETKFKNAADRVLAVLPVGQDNGLYIKEIGDLVANDDTGNGGLKHSTIRARLNTDLKYLVDTDGSSGREGRWWRT
jgi:hypothetical protein